MVLTIVEKWDGLRNNLASPRIFAVLYEMAIKGQLKVFYQIHAGECVLGDSFARGKCEHSFDSTPTFLTFGWV